MLDEPTRRLIARAGHSVAAAIARAGITPNQLTVTGGALGVVAGVLVGVGRPSWALVVWLLSRVIDGFDGVVARVSGQTTLIGGYLDITLDMLAYSAMAVGFAVADPAHQRLWLLVLVGYVMAITTTLALSSLLERAGRSVGGDRSLQFTAGLAEGGETTIVYVLLLLVPAWTLGVLWAWIGLLALTVVARSALAFRLLR
jgi:phosphatidylglycerophosphate synthase